MNRFTQPYLVLLHLFLVSSSKQQQEAQPVALPEHVARVYRVSRRVSVHMLHMIKTFAMDFFSSRDSLI